MLTEQLRAPFNALCHLQARPYTFLVVTPDPLQLGPWLCFQSCLTPASVESLGHNSLVTLLYISCKQDSWLTWFNGPRISFQFPLGDHTQTPAL